MPAGDEGVRRGRRIIVGLSFVVLAAKLVVAATTFGTNDIRHWTDFVAGVAEHGPVGVYGVHFQNSFYNHPPLVGYLLEFVHLASVHGFSIQFTIRALASLADVASTLLIFEILRSRRSIREATFAAALVAVSPVLFIISGFHGNTDPIFAMLTLLAVYLLADRNMPLLAGVSIALALGIKVVPVVALPALVVLAATRGRRHLVEFCSGFGVMFLVTWLPALLGQGQAVRHNVLGYAGSGISQWGVAQLGHWAGDPWWAEAVHGEGRFAVVVLCAALPAVLVWRRPAVVAEAVGLALVGFLLLSPAFGTQYLVWALGAAYLLSFRWATVYNLGAGVLLTEVYTRWSHGFPWDVANWWGLNSGEVVGALLVWVALGVVLVQGARRAWAGSSEQTAAKGRVRSAPRLGRS
jgi:hypothetical protein